MKCLQCGSGADRIHKQSEWLPDTQPMMHIQDITWYDYIDKIQLYVYNN
jgi:hypothetical protein